MIIESKFPQQLHDFAGDEQFQKTIGALSRMPLVRGVNAQQSLIGRSFIEFGIDPKAYLKSERVKDNVGILTDKIAKIIKQRSMELIGAELNPTVVKQHAANLPYGEPESNAQLFHTNRPQLLMSFGRGNEIEVVEGQIDIGEVDLAKFATDKHTASFAKDVLHPATLRAIEDNRARVRRLTSSVLYVFDPQTVHSRPAERRGYYHTFICE